MERDTLVLLLLLLYVVDDHGLLSIIPTQGLESINKKSQSAQRVQSGME